VISFIASIGKLGHYRGWGASCPLFFMKKTLSINIPYYENGNLIYKHVQISFVSNWVLKEYNESIKKQIEYNEKINALSRLKTKMLSLKTQEEIKDNLNRQSELSVYFDNYENNTFVLIKRLLKDNKIKDKQLLDYDFWYKHVDNKTVLKFVNDCIFKDMPETKEEKTKYVLHEDRLLIALNKYWRPLDEDYYLNKMDIPDTNEAIIQSQLPEYVQKRIWEKEKRIELFDFFKNWSH
jgi:hypothetical protein